MLHIFTSTTIPYFYSSSSRYVLSCTLASLTLIELGLLPALMRVSDKSPGVNLSVVLGFYDSIAIHIAVYWPLSSRGPISFPYDLSMGMQDADAFVLSEKKTTDPYILNDFGLVVLGQ